MRKADWVIAFLIAAVFVLGIIFFKKNWPDVSSQEHDRPSVAETLDKISDGATATLDEEDDYEEDGLPDGSDTTTYEPEEPTIDDLANLNETRAKEGGDGTTTGSSRSNGTNTRPSAYDNDNAAGGKYLVVAGTFKKEVNAQIQLKKFQQMGYNNAEIGKFNKKAYASLIVQRFNSSAEAKQLVSTLKRKGLEAYVHTKR